MRKYTLAPPGRLDTVSIEPLVRHVLESSGLVCHVTYDDLRHVFQGITLLPFDVRTCSFCLICCFRFSSIPFLVSITSSSCFLRITAVGRNILELAYSNYDIIVRNIMVKIFLLVQTQHFKIVNKKI